MKQRALIFGALVLVGVALVLWLWSHEQSAPTPAPVQAATPSSTPPPSDALAPSAALPTVNIPDIPGHPLTAQDKQNVAKVLQLTGAPINFYGKVIDQDKQPVPNADVKYSAADHYFGSGDKYQGISDDDGLFALTHVHGMGLYVEVSKEGYYQLGEKSMRSISQAQMTSPDNPVIFELRKRGKAERVIKIEGCIKIAKDETPIQMDLSTGRTFHVENGDIQIEAWTNNANAGWNHHYDWRCKITVPGGGLQSRIGDFDFEAPEEGYQPSDEIDMPANSDQWQERAQRSYFLHLGNGDYARIDFQMMTGGDHFFVITSYLNPHPGHRNLEYDPQASFPSSPSP